MMEYSTYTWDLVRALEFKAMENKRTEKLKVFFKTNGRLIGNTRSHDW